MFCNKTPEKGVTIQAINSLDAIEYYVDNIVHESLWCHFQIQ